MSDWGNSDPVVVPATTLPTDLPDFGANDPVLTPEQAFQAGYQPHALWKARTTLAKAPWKWYPQATAAMVETGADVTSLIDRAVGADRAADRTNLWGAAFEQAAEEGAQQESRVAQSLLRGFRGTVRQIPPMMAVGGVGGPVAAIGGAAVQEANQAITEGRGAGLAGTQLAEYAATQGAIEAGPALVFQGAGRVFPALAKLGVGGFESVAGGGMAIERGFAAAVKRLGLSTAWEIPEELITEWSHRLAESLAGVNPQALTPESLARTTEDVLVQTVMMGGAVNAPGLIVGTGQTLQDRRVVPERSLPNADPIVSDEQNDADRGPPVWPEVGQEEGGQAAPEVSRPGVPPSGPEAGPVPSPAEVAPVTPSEPIKLIDPQQEIADFPTWEEMRRVYNAQPGAKQTEWGRFLTQRLSKGQSFQSVWEAANPSRPDQQRAAWEERRASQAQENEAAAGQGEGAFDWKPLPVGTGVPNDPRIEVSPLGGYWRMQRPAPQVTPKVPAEPPPVEPRPKRKLGNLPDTASEPPSVAPGATEPTTVESVQRDYGTLEAPNRVALGEHFAERLSAGQKYDSILDARKEAGDLLGGDVKPGTDAVKHVDEAVEQGVVRTARRIVETAVANFLTPQEVFARLRNLYDRQPNLASRTSTSAQQQAYSTPAPLAFIVSHLAGITKKSAVYEPTAGNGMLVIGANPQNVVANELNPDRAEALRAQGFKTTEYDAAEMTPAPIFDVVVANPPFGTIKDDAGNPKVWDYAGGKTNQIDHAIAAEALETIKPAGRAVLILGAKGGKEQNPVKRALAYSGAGKRFYDYLYDHYNVVDHFTVSGDLYARQGASFPVDVIVIHGRGQSARPRPWNINADGVPRVFTSWEELANDKLADQGAGAAAGVESGRPGAGRPATTPGQGTDLEGVPGTAENTGAVDDGERGGRPGDGGVSNVGGRRSRPKRGRKPGQGRVPTGGRTGGQPGVPGDGVGPVRSPDIPPAGGESTGGGGNGPGAVEPGGLAGGVPADRPDVIDIDNFDVESLVSKLKNDLGGKPQSGPASAPQPTLKERVESQSQKAADARTAFFDAFKAAPDLLSDEAGGTNPELLEAAIRMTVEHIKLGGLKFADFINDLVHEVGRETVLRAAPYLEQAWDWMHARDKSGRLSPAASIEAMLAEEAPLVENQFQTPYKSASALPGLNTLIPTNQVQAVKRALEMVMEEHGDIDQFVAESGGFTSEHLADVMAAEQVDAAALAMYSHDHGSAFIIGDQTGVGKGRVNGFMMHWAERKGMVPIFVTSKPGLFADMIRDLTNIGLNTPEKPYQFLVTGNLTGDKVVTLPDGRVIEQDLATSTRLLQEALKNHKAGKGLLANGIKHNAIFTTYSQLQTVAGASPERRALVEAFGSNAFVILDESHNAGGGGKGRQPKSTVQGGSREPNRAEFVRALLGDSQGAFYSSATWAKNPDVIDLYFRTGMGDAIPDPDHLKEILQAGGVPLQQVTSEMLVEAGQMIRREQDYAGVDFSPKIVGIDREKIEKPTEIFRSIAVFDQYKHDVILPPITDGVVSGGGALGVDNATGNAGVDSTNFTSIVHNLIRNMLFSIKAPVIVAEVKASLAVRSEQAPNGQAPVVMLDATTESALKNYLEENPAEDGQIIDYGFGHQLQHYLDRSRTIILKPDRHDESTWIRHYLTDEQLGKEGLRLYNEAKQLVDVFDDAGMPGSPIDYIRSELHKAGIRTREITGRKVTVDYHPDGTTTLGHRDPDEQGTRGKQKSVELFNNDEVEVLFINRSGSEGISIHSSVEFKNQKQRHGIIAQAAQNIDEFMQLIGRINRTGQVNKPRYTLLMTDAPAENRPAAVLLKKLASLNANVTAARKGAVGFDVPDIMNEIGDYVVVQILQENLSLYFALGTPLPMDKNGIIKALEKKGDSAGKVTGRVAMLTWDEQAAFWQDVMTGYRARLEELEARGENPLVASTLPLQAKSLERFILRDGDAESTNPFAQPAYMERISALMPGKAMSSSEVERLVKGFYGLEDVKQLATAGKKWTNDTINQLRTQTLEYLKEQSAKLTTDDAKANLRQQFIRQFEVVQAAMREFAPGTVVDCNALDGAIRGIVTGFKRQGGAKNPSAPSAWVIEVALADNLRKARVVTSQLTHDNPPLSKSTGRETWESELPAFDRAGASSREDRWVATGNILTAYVALGDTKGRLSFFTDSEGNPRRGILMPRKFDPHKWQAQRPVVFQDPKHVWDAVTQGLELTTPDKLLSVARHGGVLTVRTETGKLKAGKYYLNRSILEAASPRQFMQLTKRWEMTVPDLHKQKRVIDAILAMSALQANEQRDAARKITGAADVLPGTGKKPGKPGVQAGTSLPYPIPTNPIPTSESPTPGAAPSTGDVVKELSRAFAVPVRMGHFRRPKALGIYKVLEKVVRTKGYGDIAVVTHEVSHHLDNTSDVLKNLDIHQRRELEDLDYKPTRQDASEGFAEYMRHALTLDDAESLAPSFDQWFRGTFLPSHPEAKAAFEQSRKVVDKWREAGAVERVIAQIDKPTSFAGLKKLLRHPHDAWEWFVNQWVNRLHPLLQEAREMTGASRWGTADVMGKMDPGVNFWGFAKTVNMAAASKARTWAKSGVTDVAGNKVGPGLRETLGPIAAELRNSSTLDEFYAYTYARHALDVLAQGKNPGITESDARFTVNQFDNRPGWREASDGLTAWHSGLIDYLVDASGLSQESADNMREMYPHYIALARKIESENIPSGSAPGSRYANIPPAVRRLKGSGREILPPLESALSYAERIIGIADQIRVGKMLRDASVQYGTLGKTVEKVSPSLVPHSTTVERLESQLKKAGADLSEADMDAMLTIFEESFRGDPKNNILTFWDNGKQESWWVRPELYRTIMAMDKPYRLPWIIDKTFGSTARMMRLGTTGLRAGFSLITNPLRDIQAAVMQSESQRHNPLDVALGTIQGILADMTNNEVAQLWKAGGGEMAQPLSQDRKFLQSTVRELLSQRPQDVALDWAMHPVESLRTLFSAPESGPRIAEYEATLRSMGWKPGQKVTFAQYLNAQLRAANVTVDFREGGNLGMWINQITPFFNAQIQGQARIADTLTSHPFAATVRGIIWLTLPSLAFWWLYKDEEWYKNLTASERWRYWHFKIRDTIIRVPKPFEWGYVFASIPEAIMDWAYRENPTAIREAMGAAISDAIPNLLPGLAGPAVEVAANRSFFWNRPLVPERLKNVKPEDQFNPHTTETAKAIGKLVGVSPIYVEHLASEWTGGLAQQLAKTAEMGVHRVLTGASAGATSELSDVPVVGRLFLNATHTRVIDDFYKRLESLEQTHGSNKLLHTKEPAASGSELQYLHRVALRMAEIRSHMRNVLDSKTLSDDDQRQAFLRSHLRMVSLASHALAPKTEAGKSAVEQDIQATKKRLGIKTPP